MIVHSPDKTYDIPRPLLMKYFETLHVNETIDTTGLTDDQQMEKIRDALKLETEAHKAIFDHLNLDYEKREQFSEEGYVGEAVHNWFTAKMDGKPEIEEITVTNREVQTPAG